ncbi:MAG: rhomboid family intramembrane serine protease [Sneathiella sp.]
MENTKEPAFNAPPATLYAVASLIVIHILLIVTSADTLNWVFQSFAFHIGQFSAALDNPSLAGAVAVFFQLNSHLFLHHDFMHLLMNASMLLAFGSAVERSYGKVGFFILFFVGGWAGALFEYGLGSSDASSILYGASGAVFGMMGATTRILLPRFGLSKVLAFAGVMMALNLIIGLTPIGNLLTGGDATISWAAHLGGFIVGVVLAFVLPMNMIGAQKSTW